MCINEQAPLLHGPHLDTAEPVLYVNHYCRPRSLHIWIEPVAIEGRPEGHWCMEVRDTAQYLSLYGRGNHRFDEGVDEHHDWLREDFLEELADVLDKPIAYYRYCELTALAEYPADYTRKTGEPVRGCGIDCL